MSTLAISYTFSPTTVIESGQVNQNFTDIVNYINNTASPVGLVAMWKGSIASIPTGWAIDTDLRDKMAIGAGNLYAYGDTGGEATHLLTAAESGLPAHSHAAKNQNTATFAVPSGAFYGLISNDGGATQQTGNNTAANASQAHNNLPPYYALAFIRRT